MTNDESERDAWSVVRGPWSAVRVGTQRGGMNWEGISLSGTPLRARFA